MLIAIDQNAPVVVLRPLNPSEFGSCQVLYHWQLSKCCLRHFNGCLLWSKDKSMSHPSLPWLHVQFSGCSLPFFAGGHYCSALSGPGPGAEERRHQQTALGVRQHVICVRKTVAIWSLYRKENDPAIRWTLSSLCFRRWSADEARILRVSVTSFMDHLSLVLETMEMFGPPVSDWSLADDTGHISFHHPPHPSRGLDSGATSSGKHEKLFNLLVLNSCQDDVITILNAILDLNAFVILYFMEIKKKNPNISHYKSLLCLFMYLSQNVQIFF